MPKKLAAPVHHSFPRIILLFLEKMHFFKELYVRSCMEALSKKTQPCLNSFNAFSPKRFLLSFFLSKTEFPLPD